MRVDAENTEVSSTSQSECIECNLNYYQVLEMLDLRLQPFACSLVFMKEDFFVEETDIRIRIFAGFAVFALQAYRFCLIKYAYCTSAWEQEKKDSPRIVVESK